MEDYFLLLIVRQYYLLFFYPYLKTKESQLVHFTQYLSLFAEVTSAAWIKRQMPELKNEANVEYQ